MHIVDKHSIFCVFHSQELEEEKYSFSADILLDCALKQITIFAFLPQYKSANYT